MQIRSEAGAVLEMSSWEDVVLAARRVTSGGWNDCCGRNIKVPRLRKKRITANGAMASKVAT